MEIEAYMTPAKVNQNSLNAATKSRASASEWIVYLFKPSETGLICTTEIMDDPAFRAAITQLRADQRAEFSKEVSPASLATMKARIFPEEVNLKDGKEISKFLKNGKPNPKFRAKDDPFFRARVRQAKILARDEFVNDTGPYRVIRRNKEHGEIQLLVHDLMLTQKYNNTSGNGAGKIFQHQLNRSLLTDLNRDEKLKAAAIAFRNCFPKNLPVVITLHFGKNGNNPHFQGWVCDRLWDSKLNTWGKDAEILDVGGLGAFRKKVEDEILRTTGTVFGDPTKKLDLERPKRTIYDKYSNSRVAYYNKTYTHADMVAGKVIEFEPNSIAREALRQHVAQVRYDDTKSVKAAAARLSNSQKNLELTKIYNFYCECGEISNSSAVFLETFAITPAEKAVFTNNRTSLAEVAKIHEDYYSHVLHDDEVDWALKVAGTKADIVTDRLAAFIAAKLAEIPSPTPQVLGPASPGPLVPKKPVTELPPVYLTYMERWNAAKSKPVPIPTVTGTLVPEEKSTLLDTKVDVIPPQPEAEPSVILPDGLPSAEDFEAAAADLEAATALAKKQTFSVRKASAKLG